MSVSSSSTRKRISAPSLRPIQLRWIVFVRSGHQPSGGSSYSSSSSAYAVTLKNHCVRLRSSTGVPQRSQQAVDDVLVRDHGLVVRAPVDRSFLPVGQPLLEEAQEQPLGPAVEVGPVRRDLAVPVDRPAQTLHLAAHVAMLRSVVSRGWPPSRIAAFSAGRPNASQPIGRSTVQPFRRRKCVTTSPIV